MSTSENDNDIAIVGMSCRFPGARNLEQFWKNLIGGVESISRLSDEEILASGVPLAWLTRMDYVKAAPVLDDDPALFDAAFFGYSATEAATMDPQQRILLELAQEALEDAACDPRRYRGRIGVFAGSAMNTYFMNRGLNGRLAEDYIPTLIVNDKDFLATRISYKLGLCGPSMTVQTACSTSLVAVHLARQSLLSGETDMALAGTVSVRVPHRAGYFYDGGGVVSPDGHVRAFDAAANGTVFGSGAGVLVLKRLTDALADGDEIHAVIKGSAVNNDGSEKAGYTAPSVNGQADVVTEALANAGVDADSVSYVEAHGSGTPVGDPIELLALTKAFRNFTQRQGFCAIGSVKTNIGHLDVAAGMAGIIKTVLALKHRQIPPTLHFSRPNPEIDFAATPFFVNAETLPWRQDSGARRAGVMSTGMGGTNAHLVLEEAPSVAHVVSDSPQLLVLSAKSPTALSTLRGNLAGRLASAPASLPDVAHTLQAGRRFFEHRQFLVCKDIEHAVEALNSEDDARVPSGTVVDNLRRPVVFLFPGVGDHYVGMAEGLYRHVDFFRQEVDRCAQFLQPHIGLDIRDLLYPRGRVEKEGPQKGGIDLKRMLGRSGDQASGIRPLDETPHCQLALFTVEYALAKLWIHWGVSPERLVGHSMGEYVAACLSGVFSLEDALRLIAARAKLVNQLPRGAMIAVPLSEDQVLPLLEPGLSVSLINGPNLCVVAGAVESIDLFQKRLQQRKILFRPVRNTHAFHSRMMDPIVDAFAAEVRKVRLNSPRLPFISNVTGTWITAAQAMDPLYWVEHCRCTARFSDALQEMWKIPNCVALEVGPGRTLGVLAMQHPLRATAENPTVLPSLRHDYENQRDLEFILNSVGRLWLSGIEVDWSKLDPFGRRQKVSLPGHPFERKHYWIESNPSPLGSQTVNAASTRKRELDDWFYAPVWERLPFSSAPVRNSRSETHWLIVAQPTEFSRRLRTQLEEIDATVDFACLGNSYIHRDDGTFEIDAVNPEDYLRLFQSLKKRPGQPLNVIHLGALCNESNQDFGFYSLMNIAKAIGEHGLSFPIRLGVITSQIHDVTGEEQLNPSMATVLGPCGVLPLEYGNVSSFSVDLPCLEAPVRSLEEWVDHLIGEFDDAERGRVIAYRGRYRWKRSYEPLSLPGDGPRARGLRERGVYLITGGTGGIGLAISRYLASAFHARLVLTRKSPFPRKEEWRQLLASGSLSDSDRDVVRELLEIENLGAEVEVFTCDVSDRVGMRQVIHETLSKHQAIHGVIHAAGILRDGMSQIKTRAISESVLAPKVEGTFALFDSLENCNPDFMVLFSSISSVVPFHGQSDYRAANAFLDAFSCFSNALGRFRTLTINWPAWRDVGILTRLKTSPLSGRAIATEDGVEAFKRALTCDLSQVIVSPEDLHSLIAQANRLEPQPGKSAENSHPTEQDPEHNIENAIAEIWSGVLGIASIDAHDKFFDIGGHSLLAMQIVSRIRDSYRINFTLRNFFDGPTIAEISQAVVTAISSEIEDLSDEEVSRLLSNG